MRKITEIIPSKLLDIPWVKEAMDNGQLFTVMLERLEGLEVKKLQRYVADFDFDYGQPMMSEDRDGEWVRFDDVEELVKPRTEETG